MSEFGALTGVSSTSGTSHAKERDLNETAGPVAYNDQSSAFGNNVDISKGQLPEGCRELGWC